jgi:hypothetical protein
MIVLHEEGLARDTPTFRHDLKEKYMNACEFEAKANKAAASVEGYIASLSGFHELAATLEGVLPPAVEPGAASPGRLPAVDFVGLLRQITALTEALGTQLECSAGLLTQGVPAVPQDPLAPP